MLKAIIWANSLHVLGPNTNITAEQTRIVMTSGGTTQYFRYDESAPIVQRVNADPVFVRLLPTIVLQTLVHFLNQSEMAVLDLAGSIFNTQIVDPEKVPQPINNGTAPVNAEQDNAR